MVKMMSWWLAACIVHTGYTHSLFQGKSSTKATGPCKELTAQEHSKQH